MARKELTENEIQAKKELSKAIAEMMEEFNGCPFFNERTKGQLDDIIDIELTIEDIFPMQDYHAIIFSELPDTFYLTGGALKDLCNNYKPEHVRGRVVVLSEKKRTKNNHEFRPIKVLK